MKGYEGFDNELGLLFDSVASSSRVDLSPRRRFAANLVEARRLRGCPESLCAGIAWDEKRQRFTYRK